MKIVRYTGAVVAFAMLCMTRDALAFPLDKPAGDSYPTAVNITSPSGQDSLFTFNNSFAIVLSDSNFSIDANYNSDGTVNSFNSVSITSAINTGATISAQAVLATLEWQSSGMNSGDLNAFSGAVDLTLVFKINFTGTWKGGTETCRTGAFSVVMASSGTTYPYTSPGLTGSPYSFGSGTFRIVSSGFNIADIAGTSCTHKTQLQNLLSVGHTTNDSGMKIDVGYPTYDYDSNKVSGS